MKVLLLDPAGALTDFGMRCQLEGHEVKMWQRPHADGSQSPIARGLIPQVRNWQAQMKWADITVLSDNAYQMRDLEKFHEEGYPILGTNMLGAKLELDRDYGMSVMEKAGLKMMPYQEFKDYNSAIEYVKANPKRYVSKPSGDVDKALSYVSKGPADMVFMLERWKSKGKIRCPFILQEFVAGIEVAVGGWIGPGGFTKNICENFENKKMMPGNFGVNTGEMGTNVKYVTESALFDDTLKRFEDYLVMIGHTGYIDLAFIITEKGEPVPLEFTSRPGWPLFNIQMELHKGSCVDWMFDLLQGKDTLKVRNETATGVIVAIPDFPITKTTGKDCCGYPVYGLEGLEGVRLCEVMAGNAPQDVDGKVVDKECIVTAGDYILIACGTGDTVKESAEEAYEVVDAINVPSSLIVRDDVGERLEKQLPILQSYGYCESWVYE